MIQRRLFFDIETQANPENIALMPEPKAPGNLKDPAKIAAAIEEKRAEMIANAALDPDYGRVLSIGMTFAPEYELLPVFVVGSPCEGAPEGVWTEKAIIEQFWEMLKLCGGYCVGYNIIGFDLPYLMRRSMYLGVKIPLTVPLVHLLARYRSEPVTDLMMLLCNWDTYKAKGLKQMARLLGIQNDLPNVDGSQVKDMTTDELRAYQESDVKLVIKVYNRMNGIYFKH